MNLLKRKHSEILREDNLPQIVETRYGKKIPLRTPKQDRVTVIALDCSCWQRLCVYTSEVVDGKIVNEIGFAESIDEKEESRDLLLWEWFTALKAAPTPGGGPDVVTFKPLFRCLRDTPEELADMEKKEKKISRNAKRILARFENILFAPWSTNEDVFHEVVDWSNMGARMSRCRPELSWEKEDGDDESE